MTIIVRYRTSPRSEDNVSKACVVTGCETIWKCRNKWKQAR